MYSLIIVDDEKDIREGLANYFPWSEVGFEVAGVFKNGEEAYTYLKKASVDVVLCDILMPKMDGLAFAERLSKEGNSEQIVFLTAHRSFEYAQKAISLGVKDYIVKPTRYPQIFDVFSSLRKSLDEQCRKAQIKSFEGTFNVSAPKINIAIAYMERNYRVATLTLTAGALNLNSYYFSSWFKKQTGSNFMQYLNRIRLQQAETLLKDFSLTTSEISDLVGYGSVKSFTKAFRRHYGLTPYEYRNGQRTTTG